MSARRRETVFSYTDEVGQGVTVVSCVGAGEPETLTIAMDYVAIELDAAASEQFRAAFSGASR